MPWLYSKVKCGVVFVTYIDLEAFADLKSLLVKQNTEIGLNSCKNKYVIKPFASFGCYLVSDLAH